MSEQEIYIEVMNRRDPADRCRFLDKACAGNEGLRNRVERLIQQSDQLGSFLENSPHSVVATEDISTGAEEPGTHIGPYKLLEQIGEGGMGVVYVAEQTEPVRRRVALKIIKPGMDTKQVIARFEAERQALAMMDHPHIAKVLDAGTTDAGRPYFVMELVRGLPVTEYCDKARLSPRQRLELFIDVCHAVQHAHQKGVIHRDLKPSNVMITVHDGRPVAKVIDFGVAKAVGQQLTERTVYTAHTQLVGTPLYMSPEQADFSSQDVDTRSDVYSLGVLLYELLTGQTPFDKETLTKAGFDEMRRIIREDEPPCPSRRFSTLSAQAISTVSQHRSVDERHLGRVLRGELDWIVMKALEKDRSRRYESASSLAADIERYLSDEPVLACPPTTMYRFQKFARKHKPALVTAAAIAACLLLGTTVSAWQAARATTAEAQANANEAQAKEAAAAEALQRQRAEANEQKAVANEKKASTERDEAQRQRDEVKTLNEKLNRTLYAAHMNLAQRAWDDAAVPRLLELLDQHRPKPGEPDSRSFEWHYLRRLHQGDLLLGEDHSAWVKVIFSPDGRRLVGTTSASTGSSIEDPMLKVWDAVSGQELYSLKGDQTVVFSPDGKYLAAALTYWDKTQNRFITPEVKVWNAETGQEYLSLKGHTGDITSVTFSLDGKRLASASGDRRNRETAVEVGEVKVWDAQTGLELLTFPGRSGDTCSVAFSPDGKRLAQGIAGRLEAAKRLPGTVKVWNVENGKELISLSGGGGSVAFSPSGKRLASRSGGGRVGGIRVPEEARVWNVETGEELSEFKVKSDDTVEFAFSPDGKRLATAVWRGRTPSIKVSDVEMGEEIVTLFGHAAQVSSLVFSPDSQMLASASADRTLRLWDLQSGQQIRSLQGDRDALSCVAFSPDGKRVASASWWGTVNVWDAEKATDTVALKGWHTAISQDFKRLVSSHEDKSVKVWDAKSRQVITTLKGHTNEVLPMAFSPDGKLLATAEGNPPGGRPISGPPVIKLWEVESGRLLHTLNGHAGQALTSVAFSPDGKLLASCSRVGGPTGEPREVKVWDVQGGQERLSLQGPPRGSPWDSVAFSSDGKRLAAGGREAKIWDSTTGEVLVVLKGRASRVTFTSDGKRIAGAALNEPVRIWDAQTGQELLTFKAGHLDYLQSIAFSPDGIRLVTACRDGVVKMWDAQTGQEILSMKPHASAVESVAFTPDGHRLASASTDGTVKIYDATPLPEKP